MAPTKTTRKTTRKTAPTTRKTRRTPAPVVVTLPEGVDYPRIERCQSRLHGWGVFARQDIAKNRRIIAYTGEKISSAESLARERRYIRDGNIWCFKLNSRWVIDGHVGGNDARFINHSCRPNCYTQIIDGIIWVRAARNIGNGEELTYNYYTEGEGQIPCLCRPGCGTLL